MKDKIKLETNSFGIFMHVCAVISFMVGIYSGSGYTAEYITQQTVLALWSIKYVVYAIFFEVVALNCRNYK